MADQEPGRQGPPLLQDKLQDQPQPPRQDPQQPRAPEASSPPLLQPSLDLTPAALAIPLKSPRGEPPPPALAALGFLRDPFGSGDEVFFAGGDRQHHLAYLQHLDQWPQGLLVVTGREGSGRSTMFKALSAGLSGHIKAARISAPPRTGEALVRRVCNGLALPVTEGADEDQLRSLVADHAKRLEAAGRSALVMLDDGQDLSQDALLGLVRLAAVAERMSALRVVVFAHPRFVGALAKTREKLKLTLAWHQIVLSALTLNETRAYLKLRVTAAGYAGKSLFAEADIQAIHEQSEGLPGRMNILAGKVLSGTSEPSRAQWNWPLPLAHSIAALAGVLVLLPALWWLLPGAPTPDAGEPASVASGNQTAIPDLRLPTLEQATDGDQALAGSSASDGQNQPRPQALQTRQADQANLTFGTLAPAAGTQRADPSLVPAPALQRQTTPAVAGSPAQGWAWLASQPPGNWTLQLVGLSERSRAEAFVAAQAQPGNFHVLASQRNGRPWYLVLHGSYGSRNAADRAAGALPAGAVPDLPWTRNLATLQALVQPQAPVQPQALVQPPAGQ